MTAALTVQSFWPLVLLAAVPLLIWLARESRTPLGRRHLRTVTLLRSLAIVSLALALMRPHWNGLSDDVSVVYALDISRSVSPSFVESAIQWIEQADSQAKPATARYLAFADRAITLNSVAGIRNLSVSDDQVRRVAGDPDTIDRMATNLEQALDSALLSLAPDRVKRIVLLTDGNQTTGDIWRVLPRLIRSQARVYPIAAKMADIHDAWLAGIDVPDGVRSAEPIAVTVRVNAAADMSARVVLKAANRVLGSRNVRLNAGVNRIGFEIRLAHAGTVTLSAEVLAEGDRVAGNNRLQQSLWVNARPRVLYVEGGPAPAARYLANALNGQGLDTRVIAPASVPASASQLAGYDALILSDVPASALTAGQMKAIEAYVRDLGGGLLFASGENVHGEQGYSDTLVEKVLPLQFRAQQKRKDLALVIAMDRSYSMKGRKMEMAKEAARATLDLLEEQHRFGVVAFDSQPNISVPMQYVRAKRKAEDQISRIQASGQTNIYPALGIVYRLLQKTDSKAKHVILLSDGDTHPADFETLVKRMASENMVVSTVAVGADADRALMGDIAKWGKGKAYIAESSDAIPQIFIEETKRAVRSNLLEEAFAPAVRLRSATFRGLDVERLPELTGYVSAKARDHAEILLATPSGAPLLARWQFGLGKTVVFTSDVKNRWAASWIEWPGYAKFWAQQVRDLLRRDSREEFDFRVTREGREALVSLSLLTPEGNFRDGLAPQVKVTRADGRSSLVGLVPAGPGTYQMRLPVDGSIHGLRFELVDSPSLPRQASRRAGVRMLHQNYADEYRSFPPDVELLQALAHATGGKIGAPVSEIFAQHSDRSVTTHRLWPWFAGLALMFYLLDIAARRAPLAWRWLNPHARANGPAPR